MSMVNVLIKKTLSKPTPGGMQFIHLEPEKTRIDRANTWPYLDNWNNRPVKIPDSPWSIRTVVEEVKEGGLQHQ